MRLGVAIICLAQLSLAAFKQAFLAPDLAEIVKQYPVEAGDENKWVVVATDAGLDATIPALSNATANLVPAKPKQLGKYSRSINYLRAGACLSNGVISPKQVRNKCPVCRWNLLEAWHINTKLVSYSYLGYDLNAKMFVVGLYNEEMYPAEYANLMRELRNDTVSDAVYSTMVYVNSTMKRSFNGYIKKLGTYVPKLIKFVGYGSAAPVAEMLARDYQQTRPHMNVSLFTVNCPAYATTQHEMEMVNYWGKHRQRMLSTRDSLAKWHYYTDTNLTRLGNRGEVVTHPQPHKVAVWMVTNNASFASPPPPPPQQKLLQVMRAYNPQTFVCKSARSCYDALHHSSQLDPTARASKFIDYTDQLDCGL